MIRTIVIFIFLSIIAIIVFDHEYKVIKLLRESEKREMQLVRDVDLVERKLDALQHKFYEEKVNLFFENNNVHYKNILSEGDIIQINYKEIIKDHHNGFDSEIVYKLLVCSNKNSPCLETVDDDYTLISFKHNENILNFNTQKLKAPLADNPLYVISIETDLLTHLYLYVPKKKDDSGKVYYDLINPVTDQGRLRQYEGEKNIRNIVVEDNKITFTLDVIPIYYNVYENSYAFSLYEDNNEFKRDFSFLE